VDVVWRKSKIIQWWSEGEPPLPRRIQKEVDSPLGVCCRSG